MHFTKSGYFLEIRTTSLSSCAFLFVCGTWNVTIMFGSDSILCLHCYPFVSGE